MWNFARYGDNPAVIDEYGEKLTYSRLKEEGEKLADLIGKRCLVFSFCANEIGSVVGYTAFLNARIVPVLLNEHLEKELRTHLLEVYHPEYVWIPERMASDFSGMTEKIRMHGYLLLKTEYSAEDELYSELALLLTTSGSTGSPKFVRQSYTNIKANTDSIIQYLSLDSTERAITTLPMNYTYGLSIVTTHLMVGATLLLTEKSLMQKEFWDFFRREGATSFGGVPYTYEMLDRLRFYRMQLPSLRYMTQAGGKLIPKLHEKFAEYAASHGKKFIVMYGQCEATARMGYLPAEWAVKKCGSMGIAIPGGRFHLTDVNGKTIREPNITGELVYEGANVTLGYAECAADLKKGDERNGVLETGDMAQMDEDGFYYIVGRKKRFLKIYGNRVNLDEVDRLIKEHFKDLDCASTGVDDHLSVFITEEKARDQVKEFLVHTTKLNPVAFRILVIDEIPKNDSGKTLYKELDQKFAEYSE